MGLRRFEDIEAWKAARCSALRSATEIQSHLYVALDQGYISADEFDELYEQTKRIKSLLIGFMRYLSKKDNQ